jgi:hypothetical protein
MAFHRGDHLRVRRPLPYSHHGIYVSDDRVIQFGHGLSGKRDASIEAVTLNEFAKGGTATLVRHGGHTWYGAWRPDADAADKIVERAEWLLATHPRGLPYDLVGWNCEHAATFCATGWPESFQVRGFFAMRALAVALGMPLLIRRLEASARWRLAAGLFSILGIATVIYSWNVSKRFWQQIGLEWRTYERASGDQGAQ